MLPSHPLSHRHCWIFDMDGTLTIAAHDFKGIKLSLDLPVDQPILESLAQLPTEEAARRRRKLDLMEMDIAQTAQAQPGALELLETLRSHNRNVAILTRNGKDIAQATLNACGLQKYFLSEFILGRDCCPPKPKPDGIRRLLDLWQAQPQQSVMVGDYLWDLEAGRNAGAATVHLDVTGAFPWPEYADAKVTSLFELLAMLSLEK
jgi:HAD superfamily hydrolase (TIGR01509 family)